MRGILQTSTAGFNLVIERLLISGASEEDTVCGNSCFNLVIERLLISGRLILVPGHFVVVSISLSSGFSFQVGI